MRECLTPPCVPCHMACVKVFFMAELVGWGSVINEATPSSFKERTKLKPNFYKGTFCQQNKWVIKTKKHTKGLTLLLLFIFLFWWYPFFLKNIILKKWFVLGLWSVWFVIWYKKCSGSHQTMCTVRKCWTMCDSCEILNVLWLMLNV